jgi:hypothetical protein
LDVASLEARPLAEGMSLARPAGPVLRRAQALVSVAPLPGREPGPGWEWARVAQTLERRVPSLALALAVAPQLLALAAEQ